MKIMRIEYDRKADTLREWKRTHWKKFDSDTLWTVTCKIKKALYWGAFGYAVIINPHEMLIRLIGWSEKYGRVEYQIRGSRFSRKDWKAFREWHRQATGEWPV